VDPELRADVARYYGAKLAEHGPGARGMDWKDEVGQRLRFERIARHVDGGTLLDVGCGSGELRAFLDGRVSYLGIDVVPEMVAACVARFGPDSARVATVDDFAPASFDWVVASGTFNVKQGAAVEAWRDHFHASVVRMFEACRRGIVFNCMSPHVDWRYDHLYYPTLDEVSALCVARLSRRFVVDHAYPLYEQTWAVFK
jgi:SAM-dependent methyltransferase